MEEQVISVVTSDSEDYDKDDDQLPSVFKIGLDDERPVESESNPPLTLELLLQRTPLKLERTAQKQDGELDEDIASLSKKNWEKLLKSESDEDETCHSAGTAEDLGLDSDVQETLKKVLEVEAEVSAHTPCRPRTFLTRPLSHQTNPVPHLAFPSPGLAELRAEQLFDVVSSHPVVLELLTLSDRTALMEWLLLYSCMSSTVQASRRGFAALEYYCCQTKCPWYISLRCIVQCVLSLGVRLPPAFLLEETVQIPTPADYHHNDTSQSSSEPMGPETLSVLRILVALVAKIITQQEVYTYKELRLLVVLAAVLSLDPQSWSIAHQLRLIVSASVKQLPHDEVENLSTLLLGVVGHHMDQITLLRLLRSCPPALSLVGLVARGCMAQLFPFLNQGSSPRVTMTTIGRVTSVHDALLMLSVLRVSSSVDFFYLHSFLLFVLSAFPVEEAGLLYTKDEVTHILTSLRFLYGQIRDQGGIFPERTRAKDLLAQIMAHFLALQKHVPEELSDTAPSCTKSPFYALVPPQESPEGTASTRSVVRTPYEALKRAHPYDGTEDVVAGDFTKAGQSLKLQKRCHITDSDGDDATVSSDEAEMELTKDI